MSNPFSSIPVRSNADTGLVDASWWNTIRSALVGYFGNAAIDETQFSIADDQSAYANISGFSVDASITRASEFAYTITRTDGTVTRREYGRLIALYDGTWTYERSSHGDDALNMTASLIINGSGQAQYLSDSMGGTYSGSIRFKSVVTFNKES